MWNNKIENIVESWIPVFSIISTLNQAIPEDIGVRTKKFLCALANLSLIFYLE